MLEPLTQAFYRNLAAWIARRKDGQGCLTVGINGAQGSGKSTAAAFLKNELSSTHSLKAAVLSLDDFYLPRAVRQDLAIKVHPLFATRGVPGTHDTDLGIAMLKKLCALNRGETLALPRFSKAEDDRMAATTWPIVEGPVDVVLFEGWCVGLPPQLLSELDEPANDLEASEDTDGRWRRSVNSQLGAEYAEWFALLDAVMFLRVPDFECVRRWRAQQEQDTARMAGGAAAGLQSPMQLDRFIRHYERLTSHALRVMPERADVLLALRQDHTVGEIRFRKPGAR